MQKHFYFIVFFSLILLFFSSCKEEKSVDSSNFVISGKFENAEEGEIISLMLKNPDENVLIDSTKFDKNGKFELSGFSEITEFYILQTPISDYDIILILDSLEKVKITADLKNLQASYNVKGSSESKLVQKLEQKIWRTTATIDSISTEFKKYYQTPKIDELKPVLDSIFFETVENQRKFSDKFIESYTSSLATLIAVSQYIMPQQPIYDRFEDSETFFEINEALRKKYPQSLHVKQMNSFCEKLKQDIENGTVTKKLDVGDKAPNIISFTPKGQKLSLDSIRTRYTLVSFWASWSTPCKQENQNVNNLYWRYYHKFDVFQVSLDQDKQMWQNEIETSQLHWFHVCDFKQWNSKAVEDYKIKSLPANFLIDADGKIVAKDLFGDDLKNKLREIFGS